MVNYYYYIFSHVKYNTAIQIKTASITLLMHFKKTNEENLGILIYKTPYQ